MASCRIFAALLVAFCLSGGNAQLTFTTINQISQLTVDNQTIIPPNPPNYDNWLVTDTVTIDRYTRLIAFRAADLIFESCSGFLASFTTPDFIFFSNGRDWKCSTSAPSGWQDLGFDDSNWAPAYESGFNGQPVTGCSRIPIDTIPIGPQAYWIWTQNYVDDIVVFCRGYTPVCDFNPCLNAGVCNRNAPAMCTCAPHFTGRFCETTFSECESNPCQNSGQCEETDEGYQCNCQIGYTGTHCETDLSPCFSFPCQNGGTCFSDEENQYSCACVDGYTGVDCETDIDDCEAEPCENGGTCTDLVNGHSCRCAPGYTGNDCAININECTSNPCLNGGSCVDGINGYDCECYSGYTGTLCETGLDECSTNPCLNGGTCTVENSVVTCLCAEGWNGFRCELNDDDCRDGPCLNGGTCRDLNQAYECNCTDIWTGNRCQLVKPHCGSILHPAEYAPIRDFWALCQIDILNSEDLVYRDTPCRELIKDINIYGNADDILAMGGAFGCYGTSEPSEMPSGACVPGYQNNATLGRCITCNYFGVCIRVPPVMGP